MQTGNPQVTIINMAFTSFCCFLEMALRSQAMFAKRMSDKSAALAGCGKQLQMQTLGKVPLFSTRFRI
jgi:hypothetical protein